MARAENGKINFAVMYATHDAFRRDLEKFEAAVASGRPDSPGVRAGWANFRRQLDVHHSVEDAAIALGQAFAEAAGDKAGTRRFGDAVIPMDEVLVSAAVDLSGRPYLVHTEPDGAPHYLLGRDTAYATTLTRHVFESFTYHARVALHVTVHAGRDWHHITEAQYKAVARALRAAVEFDPRQQGVPSTKGVL